MIVLLYIFVGPLKLMALTHPAVKNLIKRLEKEGGNGESTSEHKGEADNEGLDQYQDTLKCSANAQNELIQTLSMLLTTVVFGPVVPPLMVCAPPGIFLCVISSSFHRPAGACSSWNMASAVCHGLDIPTQVRPSLTVAWTEARTGCACPTADSYFQITCILFNVGNHSVSPH